MNTLCSNKEQVTVKKTSVDNLNCSVPFVLNSDTREQELNIDSSNLYYNPSTKTLHAPNISGSHINLIEGSAIELTHDDTNNTTSIDVNFSEGTSVITSLIDTDTILVSNTSNDLKTITALKLKEDLRLTAGDNLEFGTGANLNKISLKSALTNVSLDSGTTWNGSLITANKIATGSVSDTEFEFLNGISTAILQTSDKGASSGVCPLNSNSIIPNHYLPGSISDIIEVATYTSLPSSGDSLKIYVTIDNHKAYRWSGTSYVEISASLVIGTSQGTAYDGASGQTNADNIASKQDQLSDGSNVSIDASNHVNYYIKIKKMDPQCVLFSTTQCV